MSHAAGRVRRLNLYHGTLNALRLLAVLRFNAAGCEEKYAQLRQAMGLARSAALDEAISAINAEIGIPSGLAKMRMVEDDIAGLVEYAQKDLAARGTLVALWQTTLNP